jgi:hypothetical protein
LIGAAGQKKIGLVKRKNFYWSRAFSSLSPPLIGETIGGYFIGQLRKKLWNISKRRELNQKQFWNLKF